MDAMARRSAARPTARPTLRSRRADQRGGTILGVFIGLVLGMVVAFGIVWYLNKSPFPFLEKGGHAEKAEARVAGDTPMPLPGKPGDKVSDKPRFEFYKILPGGDAAPQAPAPAASAAAASAAAPVQPATPAATDSFYLQAGAFQKAVDADNLKAKLVILGLETEVQETNLPDKGTLYRVRVGPYNRPDEMNRVRNQLAQNGIQATVVKAGTR